jgi:hypothetical protein
VDLPVRRGDVRGQLRVYEGRRQIGRTPLVAAEDRHAPSVAERVKWFGGRTFHHIGGWFS